MFETIKENEIKTLSGLQQNESYNTSFMVIAYNNNVFKRSFIILCVAFLSSLRFRVTMVKTGQVRVGPRTVYGSVTSIDNNNIMYTLKKIIFNRIIQRFLLFHYIILLLSSTFTIGDIIIMLTFNL